VLGDPLLHVAQRLPAGQLARQLGAELRLVARAAQEHHQVPGDVEGPPPAQVVLARASARSIPAVTRRGGDVPVPTKIGSGSDADVRVTLAAQPRRK